MGSQEGDHGAEHQSKAPKDRQCPFCGVPFTSSSLGRHLDLYIKPRNPKPPDGIHDVRKIREMRNKITRRQPRNSLKKHDPDLSHEPDHDHDHDAASSDSRQNSTPSTAFRPITVDTSSALPPRRMSHIIDRDGDMLSPAAFTGNRDTLRRDDRVKTAFGTANWQGTGVIVGLPAATADMQRFHRAPRNPYSPSTTHPTPSAPLAPIPDHAVTGDETGRAAQLALHHVLDSLTAARATIPSARGGKLFDFDLYGQTFAALVLRVLPSPRALFASQPFSVPDSWPLTPPDETHLASVREVITSKAMAAGLGSDAGEVVAAHKDVDMAYGAWNRMSGAEKQRVWGLEMMRGLSIANKRLEEKKAEVRVARQRAEYFRRQHERVLKVLEGRESGGVSGVGMEEPLGFDEDAVRELDRRAPDSRDWTFEGLVGKWKGRMREVSTTEGTMNGTPGMGSSAAQSPPSFVGDPRIAPPLKLRDSEGDMRILWDGEGVISNRALIDAHAKSKTLTPVIGPDAQADTDGRPAKRTLFDYQPKSKINGTSQSPATGGEGDTRWMDAASRAVSRVMGDSGNGANAMEVDGDNTAHHDDAREMNANGKRDRPSS